MWFAYHGTVFANHPTKFVTKTSIKDQMCQTHFKCVKDQMVHTWKSFSFDWKKNLLENKTSIKDQMCQTHLTHWQKQKVFSSKLVWKKLFSYDFLDNLCD